MHRFSIGQTVRLNREFHYRQVAKGDYEVVRQLPDEHGEYQYRIKSTHENHERVVNESELDALETVEPEA